MLFHVSAGCTPANEYGCVLARREAKKIRCKDEVLKYRSRGGPANQGQPLQSKVSVYHILMYKLVESSDGAILMMSPVVERRTGRLGRNACMKVM